MDDDLDLAGYVDLRHRAVGDDPGKACARDATHGRLGHRDAFECRVLQQLRRCRAARDEGERHSGEGGENGQDAGHGHLRVGKGRVSDLRGSAGVGLPPVGPLGPERLAEAGALLARAFAADPLWVWLLPSADSRARHLPGLFERALADLRGARLEGRRAAPRPGDVAPARLGRLGSVTSRPRRRAGEAPRRLSTARSLCPRGGPGRGRGWRSPLVAARRDRRRAGGAGPRLRFRPAPARPRARGRRRAARRPADEQPGERPFLRSTWLRRRRRAPSPRQARLPGRWCDRLAGDLEDDVEQSARGLRRQDLPPDACVAAGAARDRRPDGPSLVPRVRRSCSARSRSCARSGGGATTILSGGAEIDRVVRPPLDLVR